MKIAYVYSTLAKSGGTERMIAEKTSYLAEKFGYDVTIINLFQRIEDINDYLISKKVKQVNLGIPYFSQYKYKYPKRFWVKWHINKLLKKSIIEAVKQVDPDILIGVSRFNANYISSIKCRAKKIIECHESKYNTIYDTNFNRSFFAKYFIKIYTSLYFHTIIQNADVIVTLTEGDKMLWKRAKYIDVIPNFSTMSISKYSNCTTKRVIAVGRLQWEKGFDRLLDIWKVVVSKHPDWQLEIFGEGELKEELDNMITKANINNIKLNGIAHDISKEYASSSICTVTSYFEGFSLVLLEAMKHGVPCVAFDCPFGPRNIINDASNGFLVNDGDTKLFAERLCRLIEDEELRKQFSKAAIERSLLFDPDSIMNKWKNLFEQLNSGA